MGAATTFGPTVRNQSSSASTGGLTTQAVQPRPQSEQQIAPVRGAVTASTGNNTIQVVPSTAQLLTRQPTVVSATSSDFQPPATIVSLPIILTFPQPKAGPPQTLSADTLTIPETRATNNGFVPVIQGGLSSYRPEIISMVSFGQVYGAGLQSFAPIGELMDVNFQARVLRANTLQQLVSDLSKATVTTTSQPTSIAEEYRRLNQTYTDKLSAVSNTLAYYNYNYRQVRQLEDSLEIKNISDDYFTTSMYLTLNHFFESKMQYPRASFTLFSETKILGQMLIDFRAILEGYSLTLLDLTDSDRANDTDPVTFDRTYTNSSGFGFSVESLRSATAATLKNAASAKEYSAFVNSLPQSPDDRVKLFLNFLSKELRVSRGLSKNVVRRKLTEFFNGTPDGDPFDNLVGTVGATVFEQPLGNNSLASLLLMKTNSSTTVLPFESKYIDDTGTSYIPGTRYFVDTILNTSVAGQFNLTPYTNYSAQFNNVVNESNAVLNELFEFNSLTLKLKGDEIFQSFLSSIMLVLQNLMLQRSINNDQLVSVALFRLVSTDSTLRLMLFQFLLLAGMACNGKGENRQIFTRVIQDIQTLSGLSYVQTGKNAPALNAGIATLYPYLEQLATSIETRVQLLVNKTNNIKTTATATKTIQQRTGKTQAATSFDNNLAISPTVTANVITAGLLNQPIITLDRGAIKSALLSCTSFTSPTVTHTLFKEFIDLSHKLDQAACIQGNETTYVLNDSTGRTRFNFISTSHVLLFVYETLVSLTGKYVSGDFIQSADLSKFSAQVNLTTNTQANIMFDQLVKEATSTQANLPSYLQTPNNGVVLSTNVAVSKNQTAANSTATTVQTNSALLSSLHNIKNKLADEDITIQNILHILGVLAQRLSAGSRQAALYFASATLQAQSLQTTIRTPLEPTQLRISNWLLDRYKTDQRTGAGGFTASKIVTLDERNALLSLFRDQFYSSKSNKDNRIKLLSVGIPRGFIDKVSNRVTKSQLNSTSFTFNQTDLVYLNVYNRSEEFDDLVFKPQKFLFDLGVFYTPLSNLGINALATFDQTLQRNIVLEDYSELIKTHVTMANIASLNKYSALTAAERTAMFKNHVVSGLLGLYSVLTTGLKFSEESYLIQDVDLEVDSANAAIERIVRRYFQEIVRKPLPSGGLKDILSNPTFTNQEKDELSLLIYGNNTFKPTIVETKILAPKLFDRVFTVPLNVDHFELDVVATNRTESGRRSYMSSRVQSAIRTTADGKKYIDRPADSIVFDDFFVSVDTAR